MSVTSILRQNPKSGVRSHQGNIYPCDRTRAESLKALPLLPLRPLRVQAAAENLGSFEIVCTYSERRFPGLFPWGQARLIVDFFSGIQCPVTTTEFTGAAAAAGDWCDRQGGAV